MYHCYVTFYQIVIQATGTFKADKKIFDTDFYILVTLKQIEYLCSFFELTYL